MTGAALIEDTFARLSQVEGDLCGAVFQRLFQMEPAFEDLFCMDTDGGVRRSMLTTSVNCVRGMARGDTRTPESLIEAARMIHDGYGLTEEQVNLFFVAMRDTYRDVLGQDWSPPMEAAWETLLTRLFETGRSPV